MKIKIWHLTFFLCIAIIILKFSCLIDLLTLLASYLTLLFSNFSKAVQQTNLELLDYFASGIIIFLLPILILIKGRKLKLLQIELDFSIFVVLILFFILIFAPLLATQHPDFQSNIGQTKLLPPLKKVMFIKTEEIKKEYKSSFDKFIILKNKVVKRSFDEDLIFIDSIRIHSKVFYYQGGKHFELSKDSLTTAGKQLLISEKIFMLGTDEYGRDILSRLINGARISVFIGFCSVIIAFFIGLILGFTAGYLNGVADIILNRLADTFLSFPTIFLIIIIIAFFGSSVYSVIFVLGFSGWMSLFKIIRSEVIAIKQKDFFTTAKMVGLSFPQLLVNETLPILLTPITVNLVLQFGYVILAEAALSYLGLGGGANYPSWGSMIEAGQNYLTEAWWMILFPGLALIFTLFSINDIGEKIKIYFNPQLRK